MTGVITLCVLWGNDWGSDLLHFLMRFFIHRLVTFYLLPIPIACHMYSSSGEAAKSVAWSAIATRQLQVRTHTSRPNYLRPRLEGSDASTRRSFFSSRSKAPWAFQARAFPGVCTIHIPTIEIILRDLELRSNRAAPAVCGQVLVWFLYRVFRVAALECVIPCVLVAKPASHIEGHATFASCVRVRFSDLDGGTAVRMRWRRWCKLKVYFAVFSLVAQVSGG